ncbi:MAG TPA: hypothetical protein VJ992_09290 [Gemmatimonadales bacterium]|nr:hypothetical protein [Gemmatimonadales bacterium]
MRRAAVAVGRLASGLASAVGLEGAFLAAGAVLLAVGSYFVNPAGPFFVIGIICLLVAYALTVPQSRGE